MAFPRVDELIDSLRLAPHPEGGYFRQTYRAHEMLAQSALPRRFSGDRVLSTAIYYLLPAGDRSHLHRIKSDEVWHHYLGGPLVITEISPEGDLRKTVLGPGVLEGEVLQHVVPAGAWFGAHPQNDGQYALVGCTVSPGFDFADFELAKRDRMIEKFPQHADELRSLTIA